MHSRAAIDDILAYRGLWALCTLKKDGDLTATHLAAVLIGGPHPLWGVWTIDKKFLRFAGSRLQIEETYPSLVWRRKMATYQLVDWEHKTIEERSDELVLKYGKTIKRGE